MNCRRRVLNTWSQSGNLPKVERAAERHQPMLWNDDFPTRVRTVNAIADHADVSPSQKRDAS